MLAAMGRLVGCASTSQTRIVQKTVPAMAVKMAAMARGMAAMARRMAAMAVKMAAKAPNTEDSMLAAMARTVQEIVAAVAREMAAMVG